MNADIRTALEKMGLSPSLLDNPAHRSIDVKNVGRWQVGKLPMGLQKIEGLGNPHPVAPYQCSLCGVVHDRGAGVKAFETDLGLSRHLRISAWKMTAAILADNRNVTLWCHCAPLGCHADVLAARICTHFNWFTRL